MTVDDAPDDQAKHAAAQREYDETPALQAVLASAAESQTVRRNRRAVTR